MTEKEKAIAHYMAKLQISHDEALALWEDEQSDNLPELTPEQKAVEKEMLRADRKKEETPRKRERKPDEDKRFLIYLLAHTLSDHDDERFGELPSITITNHERQIDFVFNGEKYRLTLSKPRK